MPRVAFHTNVYNHYLWQQYCMLLLLSMIPCVFRSILHCIRYASSNRYILLLCFVCINTGSGKSRLLVRAVAALSNIDDASLSYIRTQRAPKILVTSENQQTLELLALELHKYREQLGQIDPTQFHKLKFVLHRRQYSPELNGLQLYDPYYGHPKNAEERNEEFSGARIILCPYQHICYLKR